MLTYETKDLAIKAVEAEVRKKFCPISGGHCTPDCVCFSLYLDTESNAVFADCGNFKVEIAGGMKFKKETD